MSIFASGILKTALGNGATSTLLAVVTQLLSNVSGANVSVNNFLDGGTGLEGVTFGASTKLAGGVKFVLKDGAEIHFATIAGLWDNLVVREYAADGTLLGDYAAQQTAAATGAPNNSFFAGAGSALAIFVSNDAVIISQNDGCGAGVFAARSTFRDAVGGFPNTARTIRASTTSMDGALNPTSGGNASATTMDYSYRFITPGNLSFTLPSSFNASYALGPDSSPSGLFCPLSVIHPSGLMSQLASLYVGPNDVVIGTVSDSLVCMIRGANPNYPRYYASLWAQMR